MRFEIKSGGVAAILVGIAALSGAVFMLGLLAGYDVGRESQSSAAQVATAYPVTTPPASAASPVESATGSATAGSVATASAVAMPSPNPATAAESSPPATANRVAPVASAKPAMAKHPKRAAAPAATSASERVATDAAPPAGEVGAPVPGADNVDEGSGVSESGEDATAPPAVPAAVANVPTGTHAHHKPFNIQIQAAMDRSGANEMVHRLQALGYQPHLVPAQLNGQTWYRVVIGPYPTQEAAAAAQLEMRRKYNSIYGGGTGAAGASN